MFSTKAELLSSSVSVSLAVIASKICFSKISSIVVEVEISSEEVSIFSLLALSN